MQPFGVTEQIPEGGLLLRVYSGERIEDRVTIDGGAGGPTCAV